MLDDQAHEELEKWETALRIHFTFFRLAKIRKMGNVTCWLGLGAQGPAGPAGRRDTDVLENSQALFSDIRIYTP